MSVTVDLPNLKNTISRYRFAYLMTTNANNAPHAVAVAAVLRGDELIVSSIGRRSRENALARPAVSLLWPPESMSEYSLIVDGQALVAEDSLRIKPTRAVLHRPAPSPEPSAPDACGADCVKLELSA
jgi:hypothetical protein